MGWDGMLNVKYCTKCGGELNPDGARPAEVYAGTYTGLCYNCERAGAYVVRVHEDGAREISYPPSSPSWRRSREEYIGYLDCEECGGSGFRWEHRAHPQGGSYRGYCSECLKRWVMHPKRARMSKLNDWIWSAVTAAWNCFIEDHKDLEQGSPEYDAEVEKMRERWRAAVKHAARLCSTLVQDLEHQGQEKG